MTDSLSPVNLQLCLANQNTVKLDRPKFYKVGIH